MNAKKAKAIRRELRNQGIDYNDGSFGDSQYKALKKEARTPKEQKVKPRATNDVVARSEWQKRNTFKGFRTEWRPTGPLMADFSMSAEKKASRSRRRIGDRAIGRFM
jgi:hypothetical protein